MKFWRWLRWRLRRRLLLGESRVVTLRREQPATLEGGGSHLSAERVS